MDIPSTGNHHWATLSGVISALEDAGVAVKQSIAEGDRHRLTCRLPRGLGIHIFLYKFDARSDRYTDAEISAEVPLEAKPLGALIDESLRYAHNGFFKCYIDIGDHGLSVDNRTRLLRLTQMAPTSFASQVIIAIDELFGVDTGWAYLPAEEMLETSDWVNEEVYEVYPLAKSVSVTDGFRLRAVQYVDRIGALPCVVLPIHQSLDGGLTGFRFMRTFQVDEERLQARLNLAARSVADNPLGLVDHVAVNELNHLKELPFFRLNFDLTFEGVLIAFSSLPLIGDVSVETMRDSLTDFMTQSHHVFQMLGGYFSEGDLPVFSHASAKA